MKFLIYVLLGVSSVTGWCADMESSPQKIVEKADLARAPGGSISFFVKVADFEKNQQKRETTYKVFSKGNDLSLIETIDPPRLRGRKLLMNSNNLWLFLATLKRPTRVSFQQRLTGEVANGDLARTNFAQDYAAKALGAEKVEGKDCYKLELTAKNKDVTYRKLHYWVSKEKLYPVKAVFYALSGRALKSAVYDDYKVNLGKSTMTRMTITDFLQSNKRSVLVYGGFKREELDDSFFNKDSVVE